MNKPVIEEIRHSPPAISIFNSIRSEPNSFFLDGECENSKLSRYSMFGWDPFLVFRSKGDVIMMEWKGRKPQVSRGNPFDALEDIFKQYKTDKGSPNLPMSGGGVGYFSYDLKSFLEKVPDIARDDLKIPDCVLGFYDTVIIRENMTGKSFIVSTGLPETNLRKARSRQLSRMEECMEKICTSAVMRSMPAKGTSGIKSNFSRSGYAGIIRKAKEYIKKGDIYQVNLSQRFYADLRIDPADLYERLRGSSPAPFSAYLDFGDVAVMSSSPERFLLKKGRYIETRPIKGTRPRGRDKFSDSMFRDELLRSAKDHAEHIMIVDLERNDLGRICEYGTVKHAENAAIEEYRNVFHLVSTVSGKLKKDVSAIQALRAAFPGGSITGAPKIRSMEIIEELEPVKRSLYTGAIGYISFDGDMDTSIAIRTFIAKGNKAYFSVGGGIVADSDPDKEYDETIHKAVGMAEALGVSLPVIERSVETLA